MIIGVTGGSGTGKSSIARALGGVVIDADAVYHELLAGCTALRSELVFAFGTCERSGLAEVVFADPVKLEQLNVIAHKYVLEEVERRLAELRNSGERIIIDAPLLFEAGCDSKCDVTVAMLADTEVRIGRVMQRDEISRERAVQRISAQPNDAFYTERATFTVNNNGAVAETTKQVLALLGGFLGH